MSSKGPKSSGKGAQQGFDIVERAIQRNIKGVEYFLSPEPAVGLTPRKILYRRLTAALHHYQAQSDEVYRVPVLIVMAITNAGFVLDLAENNSFVGYLLKHGYDVFMLEWTPPRPEDKRLRLEDYTQRFIPECIRRVQEETGEQEVTLMGYCMGGVLSTIYAATHLDGPLRNLVCFTTPVNWNEFGTFTSVANQKHFDVDRLVDTVGNIPPEVLSASFDMAGPAKKAAAQVRLWDNMWNDELVDIHRKFHRWGAEILPIPGELFRQMVKDLMWGNKLYTGELEMDGTVVDLSRIKVPLFHAVAEHDHLVPHSASESLVRLAGSDDKTELMLKGGHLSLVCGGNAVRRMWPALDEWLSERST